MRRRTKRAVGVLVSAFCLTLVTTSSSGCAALMMRSPKSKDPAVAPRCNESRAGVAIDGVFTGLYGLTGLALVSSDDVSVAASLPFLALATAHTVSAIAGNRSASRCRNAHTAHEEWLASTDTRKRNWERQAPSQTQATGEGPSRASQPAKPPAAAGNADARAPASQQDEGRPPTAAGNADARAPASRQDKDRPPASDKPSAKPSDKPSAKKRDDKRDKPERDDTESSPDEIEWSDFWREVRI